MAQAVSAAIGDAATPKPVSSGATLTVELLAVLALILSTAARFLARPNAPLGFDEAGTGALISQPTFHQFWQLVHWDPSPPLYYLFMRLWQAGFGLSDAALRAPSLIFGAIAPLIIALRPVAGLTRPERLTWAALLALWIPGIGYSQDARGYSLLVLFAVTQTLAFVWLMRGPSLVRAAIWVGASSLTIATHYDAVFLALAQGLIFLAVKGGAALKTWPAVFVAMPLGALIVWQGPQTASYLHVGTTWYTTLNAVGVVAAIAYIFGSLLWLPFVLALLVLVARSRPGEDTPADWSLIWAALASILGAAMVIGLGVIRPTFAQRYDAPFVPGVMLAIVLLVRAVRRNVRQLAFAAMLIFGIVVDAAWVGGGADHSDSVYEPMSYERASQSLMKSGAQRLVFAWDNPNSLVMRPEQLAMYGAFFFRRAGVPVEVIPVTLHARDDPSALLLKTAEPSGASIIWIYDTGVIGTAAKAYPPRISTLDSRWRCERFGEKKAGVIACRTADVVR